jgi:hypothetical protein
MSTIDRRAFVAGFLAVTVAGCSGANNPNSGNNANIVSSPLNCVPAPAGVSFLTAGCWTQPGTTLVYVVT